MESDRSKVAYSRSDSLQCTSVIFFKTKSMSTTTKLLEKLLLLQLHKIQQVYATMAVSVAVLDMFSVKEWPDLEIWVWNHSRSLKMARFDRPCMTFY